jgi:hypothetical protein
LKRYALGCFAAVILALTSLAADPPTVIFPMDGPVAPQPQPPNPPKPVPAKIGKGQWYIISSAGPLLVEGYGIGGVSISNRKGPITMPADGVIGWDKDESDPDWITIPGPHVYLVKATKSGPVTLRVQSAINRLDDKGAPIPFTLADVIRRDVTVELGPVPPGPTPPPDPIPDPDNPAPIPAAGLRVLVIWDRKTDITLPEDQKDILYGKKVRDYLDAKCIAGPDNRTKEYRFWPDGVSSAGESKLWQDAYARKRTSLPWVLISNGKTGFEGPLPANEATFLELVKKYEQ